MMSVMLDSLKDGENEVVRLEIDRLGVCICCAHIRVDRIGASEVKFTISRQTYTQGLVCLLLLLRLPLLLHRRVCDEVSCPRAYGALLVCMGCTSYSWRKGILLFSTTKQRELPSRNRVRASPVRLPHVVSPISIQTTLLLMRQSTKYTYTSRFLIHVNDRRH